MDKEQILELARKCLDAPNLSRDEWKADDEQLCTFAWLIYGIAVDETLQDYESKF